MKDLIVYFKRTFLLGIKETIAYPATFWMVVLSIPLYALVQIVFLETIYAQTSNFVGYTKYQGYILFGTFMMVQAIGHMLFFGRLSKFKNLIKGEGQESFEMALTKPIDAQIFVTLGKFGFGSIVPFFVTIFIVIYGVAHEPHAWSLATFVAYFFLVCGGVLIFYLLLLFISIFLFWFPELQVVLSLWESVAGFGQYPSGIYRGATGILLNVIIPVTLMASIPVEFLFGKKPWYWFSIYAAIVAMLFLFVRIFWNAAMKRYSGSGS